MARDAEERVPLEIKAEQQPMGVHPFIRLARGGRERDGRGPLEVSICRKMRKSIPIRVAIGASFLLGGCDYGYATRTFQTSFEKTNGAVMKVVGEPPTKTKNGTAFYGRDKPPQPGLFGTEDIQAKVKRKSAESTKVEIKVRVSQWFVFTSRERRLDKEEELLNQIDSIVSESRKGD